MVRFFLIILVVVFADQVSKQWILNHFQLYDSTVVIPGFFNLTFLRNTGAAFGMFAGHPVWWRQFFFISVCLVALVVIVIMVRKLGKQNTLYQVSLACIGGGAIGNLLDRIRYGSVVDFLDVYIANHHWPAFNVADSAITTGVALFLLTQFLEEWHNRRQKKNIS